MPNTLLIAGSSRGIGRATALHFADQGWRVIATMRNPQDGVDLDLHPQVTVVAMDVEDPHSVNAGVQTALQVVDAIDVVVNNAGYGVFGALETIPAASIDRQFSVNLFGMMRVCQAILPHFRQRQTGLFIQMSSMAGKIPFPLGSVYNASKFAVEGFAEGLYFELQAIGAKLKIIEPGVIATDALKGSLSIHHDAALSEYEAIHRALLAAFDASAAHAAAPQIVAEAIFEAANDNSEQLRYIVGADAKALLETRENSDDKDFLALLKTIYKL